jgi:hypothetical protein
VTASLRFLRVRNSSAGESSCHREISHLTGDRLLTTWGTIIVLVIAG